MMKLPKEGLNCHWKILYLESISKSPDNIHSSYRYMRPPNEAEKTNQRNEESSYLIATWFKRKSGLIGGGSGTRKEDGEGSRR